jgi:hypothetical protein
VFIAKVTTAPADTAMPQLPRSGPAPIFVGRETELASLRSRLEEAGSGQRRIVFVAGEPAIVESLATQALVHRDPQKASWM